jgi:50S ribosomal subunit-associated GTPase HflX
LDLLAKLKADKIPRIYVFNKLDLLDDEPSYNSLARLSQGHKFVTLSSHSQDAVNRLRDTLLAAVRSEQHPIRVFVPYSNSDVLSTIYGKCRVVSTDAATDGLFFTLEGESHVVTKIHDSLKASVREVQNA